MKDSEVIRQLTQWAEQRPSVRAMILTSSRTTPHATVDAFSDYDVILAVTDMMLFFGDRSWLSDFGPVLVVYRDPLNAHYGLDKFAYITQYENGLKIDFSVWPVEMLRRAVAAPQLPDEFDVGYTVLLDKDGLTAGLKPPSHQAYIPKPPTEGTYRTVIEEFFQEATYVAKHLWRDDLMPAKYNLDYGMKHVNLLQMLVWRFEMDCNWLVKPGAYGKGLKKRIRPEFWAELERTYVGAGPEENWDALFRTISLFRGVAVEVGEGLGYAYPRELDRRCMAYFERVKSLGPAS